MKRRFDDEGIEIPWPHVKLYFGETPDEKAKTTIPREKPSKPKRIRGPEETGMTDVKGSGAIDGGGGDGGG